MTVRKKCFLDNDCSWCWACSNVYSSELRDMEAHRSEMELMLEVTFPVYATSPPGSSNWNKSHLEAFMPYFLPFLTRVEFLPILIWWVFSGVHILSCCCPVTKLCPTLWGATDCSMPGLPVLHCLPEFVQIHVHWVSEAIPLSHPLSPSSPPALNLSQHQDLFQ